MASPLKTFIRKVLSLNPSWTVRTRRSTSYHPHSSASYIVSGTDYLYESRADFQCKTPEGLFSGFLEYSESTGDAPMPEDKAKCTQFQIMKLKYRPEARAVGIIASIRVLDQTYRPGLWLAGRDYSFIAATVDDLARRHAVVTISEFRVSDQYARQQAQEKARQAAAERAALRKKYGGS